MNQVGLPPNNDFSTTPQLKQRAVVFGGGIGMFPPLMERFKEEFEIVAVLSPKFPTLYRYFFLLISIRWPRNIWYRKWMYFLEKTPIAFRIMTNQAASELRALKGQYDLILSLGAMFAPGIEDKPIYVFTDSCRWLSSRNEHDEISHFHSARAEKKWFELEGQVYASARRVFVGSEFVRRAITTHYPVVPKRVVTTNFGAGSAFGEKYDKSFDGRTILYVGKGDFEKKGGMLLMRAFEIVRTSLPHATLHIVGQERLPISPGVVNHGFVRDRIRLIRLMQEAHVFALPSLVDRNPISILEAMAAATPCIASDYGAMPEIVGDAGLIVRCNDVQALADALILILKDNRLAEDLGRRGRVRYEQIYNWDAVWRIIRPELMMELP